jgi:pimeloyl-ACP methyl ester carboxylesterase
VRVTPEALQLRIYGPSYQPTLVYLPGLHGDWTLVGSFRRALNSRACFVEITYPRTLTWSLQEYASAIEESLSRSGVAAGWLLGESFGSQIAWPLATRGNFNVQGLILAGGFGRHPTRWGVWLAERLTGRLSPALLSLCLQVYAGAAKLRYRNAPEVLRDMAEFFSRRTELDRLAAQHRLRLILENDPCLLARAVRVPVYAMTGVFDPVVPWWPVRGWLRSNCPALREHRLVWRADHTVLATAPQIAAEQVIAWMLAGV